IQSTNLLVADCGQYCVALTGGGKYNFNHSTFANYWTYDVRQEPAFIMTNTFSDISGATQVRDVETSTFRNGIIYGNNTNEFKLAFDNQLSPDILFKNFLFRTDQSTLDASRFEQSSIYRNQEPGFVGASDGNFHLKENAYARGKGFDPFGVDFVAQFDLDHVQRPSDVSDLGCYTFE
ncbi:MAG: hypothetical protein ABIY71_11780, partial [Flavobacteriales bacterium]